jgi:hypothetical protein
LFVWEFSATEAVNHTREINEKKVTGWEKLSIFLFRTRTRTRRSKGERENESGREKGIKSLFFLGARESLLSETQEIHKIQL